MRKNTSLPSKDICLERTNELHVRCVNRRLLAEIFVLPLVGYRCTDSDRQYIRRRYRMGTEGCKHNVKMTPY